MYGALHHNGEIGHVSSSIADDTSMLGAKKFANVTNTKLIKLFGTYT